jgi:hypothetical protein
MDVVAPPEKPPVGSVEPKTRGTWLPILLGVLCGILSLCGLAEHEPSVFWRLTAWMFNEEAPVKLIEPRTIHFTLFMLALAAVGGCIGVLFSRWPKRTACLFLAVTLAVIAGFWALGRSLELLW